MLSFFWRHAITRRVSPAREQFGACSGAGDTGTIVRLQHGSQAQQHGIDRYKSGDKHTARKPSTTAWNRSPTRVETNI